jgi:ABC-type lipoprotein release transport system permease subunit
MKLLAKIAFRNLFRHKVRSLSIGFVIITGTFFMTLGNGTIAGMVKNLERNLVKGFAGDITLLSMTREQDNITGSTEEMGFLENFKNIKDAISKQEYVERFAPLILGNAAMLDLSQSQSSDLEPITFFGIDSENYKKVFNSSIEIIEGAPLKKGEKGILVNIKQRERIYSLYNVWLLPEGGSIIKENLMSEALANTNNLKTRDDLVLMGMTGSITATDVRIPIKGIFKYTELNEMFNNINLIDIETSRECMGYLSTEDMVTNLSKENGNLLNTIDTDPASFYSEDNTFIEGVTAEQATDYTDILKQKRVTNKPDVKDNGIYSIAQINIREGVNLEKAVNDLNQTFKKAGLNKYVRAVSWKNAWSVLYRYASINQTSLLVFIYIVYFAAILMIANSLSMAAMERTSEIGTMRTVGTRKGFIARMFVMEATFLSFIFGGLGILLGVVAIKILAGMELKTSSVSLQTMFGGSQYSPLVDINGIVTGIIQLGIITIIAVIYPVIVARRINPIDAIKKN